MGADRMGVSSVPSMSKWLVQIASSPILWVGAILYVASFLVWIHVLSKAQVSWAYPIMSLSYVAVFIAGVWLFKEDITPSKVIGVILITLGVSVMLGYHK